MGDVDCQYYVGGGHPISQYYTSVSKAGAAAANPSMRYILEGNVHITALCEAHRCEPGSPGEEYLHRHGYVYGYYCGSRNHLNKKNEAAVASAPPLMVAVRGATPDYYESRGQPGDWAPKPN